MRTKPKRGEIWWVNLDPTRGGEIAKTRPCVVLTRDALNEHRLTVVVIPLSTALPRPPLLIPVAVGRSSMAVIDQIRAVTHERFSSKMGMTSDAEMAAIAVALRDVLEV